MRSGSEDKYSASESDPYESLYRDQVPAFAPELLARLYGSLYSVLPAMRAQEPHAAQGIFTYVCGDRSDRARQQDCLLMFRLEGRTVRVLNEGMQLSQACIERFCRYVFNLLPDVAQIDFHAIAPLPRLAGGRIRAQLSWPCTEDIVIDLPKSTEAYMGQLGKATRKSIRKHLSRASRELEGFSHRVISGATLDAELVRQIVEFNHARMRQQGRESAIDESATQELIDLIRSKGEASLIVSGLRICAGTLACRIGDDIFSLVNAHDPAFDFLGLGNLCRHLMIMTAINTGARRFHLMGGNLAAKRATLATRQRLHHVSLYRSRLAMLSDLPDIVQHSGKACAFALHCWAENQLAFAPHSWRGRCVGALRYFKRFGNTRGKKHTGNPVAAAPVASKPRSI